MGRRPGSKLELREYRGITIRCPKGRKPEIWFNANHTLDGWGRLLRQKAALPSMQAAESLIDHVLSLSPEAYERFVVGPIRSTGGSNETTA